MIDIGFVPWKRMFITAAFLICTSVLSATNRTALTKGEEKNSFKCLENVSYLGENREEKMDIYLPLKETGKPYPVVLFIHGGGWAIGSKTSNRAKTIAKAIVEQGYAVCTVDYKLTKFEGKPWKSKMRDPGWPQNIYDCKSAVQYIRKQASKYHFDQYNISAMGCSAGGHLALLTAISYENQELNAGGIYQDVPTHVNCVISFYGIPDIRTWGGDAFMGLDRKEHSKQWELASPVCHLSDKSPPVMLIHGDSDETVDVQLSIDFAKKLKGKKVPYELIVVKGGRHSFNLNVNKGYLKPDIFKFLKTHLRREPLPDKPLQL